jgi:hypothetical protein
MSSARFRFFLLPLLCLLPCAFARGQSQSADAGKAATPILIELFTSEGCSSCPPADAWLQRLDASQPIPGAQAIVLSEHVDYWNHDGWMDPFSSPLLTERQNEYARIMGLSSPYTPQLIVDGKSELALSDTQQVSKVLQEAAKAESVPVSIGTIRIEGGSPAILRAHIAADGTAEKHNADVFAVLALDRAESQVLHGENGGRRLTHVAVAQEIVKIGKLEKGRSFAADYQLKLKPGLDAKNLRLVVFVQESGPGQVLGAAVKETRACSHY